MRAHFNLPSVEAEEAEGRPPISVKFEIPYFTTSGIQVGRFFLFIDFKGICYDFDEFKVSVLLEDNHCFVFKFDILFLGLGGLF